MTNPTLNLGDRAHDPVSGLTGTITGIVTYLDRSAEALIVPFQKEGNKSDSFWIPLSRLESEFTDLSKVELVV